MRFNFFHPKENNSKANNIVRSNKPRTLEDEFLETYLSSLSKPLGNEEDAWKWMCERLRYFKQKYLDPAKYMELCWNAITNLPECYVRHFDEFISIVGDLGPIIITCERLIVKGSAGAAKIAADPCLKYLMKHSEKFTQGQICFNSAEEAIIYLLEDGKDDHPKAEDNYSMFFVCYARILDNIPARTQQDIEAKRREKEKYLQYAVKISPCNAAVWEAMAGIYTTDNEEKYQECIKKALRYSVRDGEPYGLGQVYSNLALHYSLDNHALSKALCELSKKYKGDPRGVEYILSKFQFKAPANCEETVRQAGIQVGYSLVARMAQIKAKELGVSSNNEEEKKVEPKPSPAPTPKPTPRPERRTEKHYYLATSDYEYEVTDKITVIGRGSAMSEYLRRKPMVSRVHARLIKENEKLYVTDMNSVNGTYVNGVRIGEHRQQLKESDKLQLGGSGERGAIFTVKIREH